VEIEGYEDLVEIGRGGYAVVFKAHQAAFGRSVAIKVLTNPGFGETDRARFEREALAMGRLSWHPNIVIVHDTGTTSTGMPFLVEEFLEGGSLGDKLRRSGPFSPAEALSDLVQLCAAVHTAHEADLLHRDIKPDNALVDAFGRVKLADFGIAAVTGSTLTATGIVTATIAHAAPEVLTGERATPRADVYSLGSTLFELLTGAPAFIRETDESIVPLVIRVTTDPVPDLREHGVPEPVVEAVEWAMAKSPDDRPASALELGQRLQSVQQQLGLKVTDLSVRGGPTPLHDDTVVGAPPVPPPVVAVTPPPPAAPVPQAPVPGAMTAPDFPAGHDTSPHTVSVPPGVGTPPPGQGAAPTGPPPRSGRSKLPAVVAALVLVGLVVVAIVALSGGDDGGGGAAEDFGSARDDEQTTTTRGGRGGDGPPPVAAEIPVGDRPFRLVATDDAVWVTDSRSTTVDRIDLDTNTVVETVDIGGEPSGIAANSAGVWVSNYSADTLERIDPAISQVVATIPVGAGPRNVAATETAVWVANIDGDTVSRIDPGSNTVSATIPVGQGPRGIVADDQEVWVTNLDDGTVSVIDAETNQVIDTNEVGGEPGGIEFMGDSVWVTETSTDVIVQIDRATGAEVQRIPVGVDPGGTAASEDLFYVSASGDDVIYVLDADGDIVDQLTTGDAPGGLSVTDTDLWVANTEIDTVGRIPLG